MVVKHEEREAEGNLKLDDADQNMDEGEDLALEWDETEDADDDSGDGHTDYSDDDDSATGQNDDTSVTGQNDDTSVTAQNDDT